MFKTFALLKPKVTQSFNFQPSVYFKSVLDLGFKEIPIIEARMFRPVFVFSIIDLTLQCV